MVTKKDRRHNGYVTPQATIPNKLLLKFHLFVDEFYDDWEDYRDGFRDCFKDFKKIKNVHMRRGIYFNQELFEKRIQMNKKQERLARIRKIRL